MLEMAQMPAPAVPRYTRISGGTHVAMRKRVVARHAIWREVHYGPTVYFFISDVMAEGMAAQGMRGHDYDSSLKHIDEVEWGQA